MTAAGHPPVAVIGLGYVGLAQAVALAAAGRQVVGVDTNRELLVQLRQQHSPVDTVTDRALAEASPQLLLTDDMSAIDDCSELLVCVPTPLGPNGDPDLGQLLTAVKVLAERLQAGQLVVIESTVQPGTTQTLVQPLLESSGLRVGYGFSLACAPGRLNPGSGDTGPTAIPRVVGGVTRACTLRAQAFYQSIAPVVHTVSSPAAAEAAKMLENAYRLLNVAFAHEFAEYCARRGLDNDEVLDAAATKPFGFAPFNASAGVGGHCIPVDPVYLAADARQHGMVLRTLEAARDVADRVPGWVVAHAEQVLDNAGRTLAGARVAVLGLTYKPEVSDTRNSPAIPVLRLLDRAGARVSVHDPHVAELRAGSSCWSVHGDLQDVIQDADLVLILQPHRAYAAVPSTHPGPVLTAGHYPPLALPAPPQQGFVVDEVDIAS